MKRLCLLMIVCLLSTGVEAGTFKGHRPQRYATFKAHTILPDTLQFLVKREGKQLFKGLYRGLAVPRERINDRVIIEASRKISVLVNNQRPFKDVIHQMGYVSGLLAVYSNPSLDSKNRVVIKGFEHYLNVKLERCLFVFDGYKMENLNSQKEREAWLNTELARIKTMKVDHRLLLENRYSKAGQNPRYIFNERSAVFGVASIYFSNLARLSAHLWYYAWSSAHGDVTKTPFRQVDE